MYKFLIMIQEEKTIAAVRNHFDVGTELLEAIRKSFEPEPRWPKEGDEVWFVRDHYHGEVGTWTQQEDSTQLLTGDWPTRESAEAMKDAVRALEKGKFEVHNRSDGRTITISGTLAERFLQAHADRDRLRGV